MMRPLREWEKDHFVEWDTFEPGSYRLCVGPRDRHGVHRFIFSRRDTHSGWYVEKRLWFWITKQIKPHEKHSSGTSQRLSTGKRKFRTSTAKKQHPGPTVKLGSNGG